MRRLIAFGAAIPLGLATGLAAWLTASGASLTSSRLAPIEAAAAASRARPAPAARVQVVSIDAMMEDPLFRPKSGPGSLPQPEVRLDGVSISRGRAAALLAVAGGAPQWVLAGESLGGVTLVRILGSAVVVDRGAGRQDLMLGQHLGGSTGDPMGGPLIAAPQNPAEPDTAPAGFRSPPPPASAPGMSR